MMIIKWTQVYLKKYYHSAGIIDDNKYIKSAIKINDIREYLPYVGGNVFVMERIEEKNCKICLE